MDIPVGGFAGRGLRGVGLHAGAGADGDRAAGGARVGGVDLDPPGAAPQRLGDAEVNRLGPRVDHQQERVVLDPLLAGGAAQRDREAWA